MRTDPVVRLRLLGLVLFLLALVGTAGYMFIEGMSPLDAAYMTVITLATVGYRELKDLSPAGKVFTMVLIVVGVGTIAWALELALEAVGGEQFTTRLRRRRMERMIAGLHNHYIVCGHGRMGQQITQELQREGLPLVVIENNPQQIPLLERLGYPFVVGNAADDSVLIAAGVNRCKALVAVGPSDPDNVFITLSARGLNPNIYIVARSVRVEDEEKLRRAGADKVLSPYVIGGRRMAVALLRPTVADLLDIVMHSEDIELDLEEVTVADGALLAGRTLEEVGLASPAGPTVIGLKTRGGSVRPVPGQVGTIHAGDVLVVLGTKAQVGALRRAAMGAGPS